MIVTISDSDDRKYLVQVPDDSSPDTWQYGIKLGPPDLTELGLPLELEVRLHNELFNRGLITSRDVRKRAQDIQGALQSVLKLDTSRIVSLYG